MQYRRLGRAGLHVSTLSLGSWVTYHHQLDVKSAVAAFVNRLKTLHAQKSGQLPDLGSWARR